ETLVDDIIAKNPDKVEQAKTKPAVIGWFVGQVMKASGGKANPQAVNGDRLHDKDRNLPNMPTSCWQGGRNPIQHVSCDGLRWKQSTSRSSRRIAGLPRDREGGTLDDASAIGRGDYANR